MSEWSRSESRGMVLGLQYISNRAKDYRGSPTSDEVLRAHVRSNNLPDECK